MKTKMWAALRADGSLYLNNNAVEITPFPSKAESLRRMYRRYGAASVAQVTVTWSTPKPAKPRGKRG